MEIGLDLGAFLGLQEVLDAVSRGQAERAARDGGGTGDRVSRFHATGIRDVFGQVRAFVKIPCDFRMIYLFAEEISGVWRLTAWPYWTC